MLPLPRAPPWPRVNGNAWLVAGGWWLVAWAKANAWATRVQRTRGEQVQRLCVDNKL